MEEFVHHQQKENINDMRVNKEKNNQIIQEDLAQSRNFGRNITNLPNQSSKFKNGNQKQGKVLQRQQRSMTVNNPPQLGVYLQQNYNIQVNQQMSVDEGQRQREQVVSDDAMENEIEVAKKPQQDVCYQYIDEIFQYIRVNEEQFVPTAGYMALRQDDINEKMRAILIDWLVDVHMKFKLVPNTLYITINLIDRHLQNFPIHRQKLQLVGVSAMFIACKYEEIYAPDLQDFVYVCDKAYTKQEILDLEGRILQGVNFNLTYSSPLNFLERFKDMCDCHDEKTVQLAKYILELCLMEFKMLKYLPSNQAASALYLANKILLKKSCWNEQAAKKSNYNEVQLKICARDMIILFQNSERSSLGAIRKKYGLEKYGSVSKIKLQTQDQVNK